MPSQDGQAGHGGKENTNSWQYPLGKRAIFRACRKSTDDLAPLRGRRAKGENQNCVLVLLSLLSYPSYSIYIVTIRHPPSLLRCLFPKCG